MIIFSKDDRNEGIIVSVNCSTKSVLDKTLCLRSCEVEPEFPLTTLQKMWLSKRMVIVYGEGCGGKWEGRGEKKVSEFFGSPLYGRLKVSLVVCFLMDAYGTAF